MLLFVVSYSWDQCEQLNLFKIIEKRVILATELHFTSSS